MFWQPLCKLNTVRTFCRKRTNVTLIWSIHLRNNFSIWVGFVVFQLLLHLGWWHLWHHNNLEKKNREWMEKPWVMESYHCRVYMCRSPQKLKRRQRGYTNNEMITILITWSEVCCAMCDSVLNSNDHIKVSPFWKVQYCKWSVLHEIIGFQKKLFFFTENNKTLLIWKDRINLMTVNRNAVTPIIMCGMKLLTRLYWACDYLSMLRFKLIHVRKRVPGTSVGRLRGNQCYQQELLPNLNTKGVTSPRGIHGH